MSQAIVKRLSKRLRDERTKLNLSQETVAQRAKVSRNYIGMLERGERNPTVSKLEDIAGALGMEASELLR